MKTITTYFRTKSHEDITHLEHGHSKEEIVERLKQAHKPSYIRDFIYGGIDGAITTFAIVAGVVGAGLSANVILVLGLANLLADGFSMAASNYSGVKSVIDELSAARQVEKKHIEIEPEGEREEVRQILVRKGLSGETLEDATDKITSDRNRWIDFMLVEEYGFALNQPSPLKSGMATFVAFCLCGAVPLLPFAFGLVSAFTVSVILTLVVFFLIGAWKSQWANMSWLISGLETFTIGGVAAALAFLVGYWLRGFVG